MSHPEPRVVPVPLSRSTSYLVVDAGVVLVDPGGKQEVEVLLRALEEQGVEPRQLRLILLTHGSLARYRTARELRRRTGAAIAVHPHDAKWLEAGREPPLRSPEIGSGWRGFPSLRRRRMTESWLPLQDGMSLEEHGVRGRVLHTPGHTPGSVSVALAGGAVLVGDLLQDVRLNGAVGRGEHHFPMLTAREQWTRSIERVLSTRPGVLYPTHGECLDGPTVVTRLDGVSTATRLLRLELGERVAPDEDRAEPAHWVAAPPRDLIGVALSGGGVRSATFNLGLLQGLSEMKLLLQADYLTTVSGGGYMGSFWTAWRSRHRSGRGAGAFPGQERSSTGREAREIRHLREFSNFLAPRLAVFSYDTGRLLVTVASAILPSLLAALSVIALALVAWLLIGLALFASPGGPGSLAPYVTLAAITGLVLWSFEARWRRSNPGVDAHGYAGATLLAISVTLGCWWMLRQGWGPMANAYGPGEQLPMPPPGGPLASWAYLLAPSICWGSASLVFVLVRWLTSRHTGARASRGWSAALDRAHSRVLLALAVWLVISALWSAGVLVYARMASESPRWGAGLGGAAALAGVLFAWAQKRLGSDPSRPLGGAVAARLRPLLPQLLAYLSVSLLVVLMSVLVIGVDRSLEAVPRAPARVPAGLWAAYLAWPPLVVGSGAVLILLLVLRFLDPNRVGLHAFYKGRIARAYLGASNPDAGRITDEHPEDDLPLDRLAKQAPLHLICCAANDLRSHDGLASLHRGAASATLSRVGFSVGDESAPWAAQRPVPSLAAAVTASGAAFNSLMGSKSRAFGPAVTFLMSAFNLRLGLWLPHPTRSRSQTLADDLLPGLPFLKEMFGFASARGRDVHLSDGGHFENMAVYELIRRHCRYVIASDCGMDGDLAFDDLGNLVRRVREDFGVEIDIDLAPLRAGESGFARQPMVAGDIRYPTGDRGVLLLFKPTLVGDEPADIMQYKRRNAAFPHESTGDQFYDEAQWESYRRLGQHAAHSAFRFLETDLSMGDPPDAARVFAQARREWLPIPAGYEARLTHIAAQSSALDVALRRDGCQRLLHEVYKEVHELDRQARRRAGSEDGDREAPAAERLTPDELTSSLAMIRQAIQFMEEIYLAEQLETHYRHPLYLGLINYFARWAYAPLFRMWWPLLRSLCSQPFSRFMEARFGLVGMSQGSDTEEELAPVQGGEAGFAAACWRLEGRREPDRSRGERLIPFHLAMRYHQEQPYRVQAALVLVRRSGSVACWDAEDFYVPPGLWGVGIGEAFLRDLRERPVRYFGEPEPSALEVRIRSTGDTGGIGARGFTEEMQLYRSAHFFEAAGGADDGRPAAIEDGRIAVPELFSGVGDAFAPRPSGGPRSSGFVTFRYVRAAGVAPGATAGKTNLSPHDG